MSYVVLARKWRPQQFSDVLGQEHVTRTLTNAINASRIAHAFLFSGPRGVGKTSAARILAKALCCESTGGPTAAPCGACRQCVEITEGRSTDVFEIDAASHTGVDNVREIIDNVRYLPSSARFKIYVIDEVHMLSTGAFNALLKTLEEPPLHVKFILATTDVHKVPVTILSRCQRYDFRRIPLAEIADRLSSILTREGIDHDPSALSLIAREAEGSMRDAQSLLEQVLASADGRKLDGALVRESLGVVDGALIVRAFDALLARDPGALIELASEVHARGLDLKRFGNALVEESRDLLCAKLVKDPQAVLDRPKDEIATLISRAKQWETVSLERVFNQLCEIVEDVGVAQHPRFTLEIGLASIAEQPARVPVEELLDRLQRMETQLIGVAPNPQSQVRRAQDWRTPGRNPPQYLRQKVEAEPQQSAERPEREDEPKREDEPELEDELEDEREDAGLDEPRPATSALETKPAFEAERVPVTERAAATQASPATEHVPAAQRAPATRSPSTESRPATERASATQPPATERASATQPPATERASATQPPATERSAPVAAKPRGDFAGFVELLKKKRPSLAATLSQVRPLEFTSGEAELGCESAFDQAKLEDPDTRAYLEKLLAEYFGAPTHLKVTRKEKPQAGAPAAADTPATLNEVEDRTREARRSEKGSIARTRPAVQAVSDELGATISKVRVIDDGS